MNFKVSFVIGQIHPNEIAHLKSGEVLVSKMFLTSDDYRMFHYQEGDSIQVETSEGDRLWCTIQSLEIIDQSDTVILIFTLSANFPGNSHSSPG